MCLFSIITRTSSTPKCVVKCNHSHIMRQKIHVLLIELIFHNLSHPLHYNRSLKQVDENFSNVLFAKMGVDVYNIGLFRLFSDWSLILKYILSFIGGETRSEARHKLPSFRKIHENCSASSNKKSSLHTAFLKPVDYIIDNKESRFL